MPTYRFKGTGDSHYENVRYYGNVCFKAGENKPVDFYIPEEYSDFEKISDDHPAKCDVLFSKVVSDTTVDIPFKRFDGEANDWNLPIIVSAVTSGNATIKLADDMEPLPFGATDSYYQETTWHRAAKITITGTVTLEVVRRRCVCR